MFSGVSPAIGVRRAVPFKQLSVIATAYSCSGDAGSLASSNSASLAGARPCVVQVWLRDWLLNTKSRSLGPPLANVGGLVCVHYKR